MDKLIHQKQKIEKLCRTSRYIFKKEKRKIQHEYTSEHTKKNGKRKINCSEWANPPYANGSLEGTPTLHRAKVGLLGRRCQHQTR